MRAGPADWGPDTLNFVLLQCFCEYAAGLPYARFRLAGRQGGEIVGAPK